MDRYLRKGAEKEYITKAGARTTVYQKREVDISIRTINARRAAERKKYQPSARTGTMLTIQEGNLLPRKNNLENIPERNLESYFRSLEKALSESERSKKQNRYKENFLQSIEDTFGRNSDLYQKVNSLDESLLTEYFYTDDLVSIRTTSPPMPDMDVREIELLMLERIEQLEGQ